MSLLRGGKKEKDDTGVMNTALKGPCTSLCFMYVGFLIVCMYVQLNSNNALLMHHRVKHCG